METQRWVIASNNPGKLKEIRQLLAPYAIDLVPQSHLGVAEADEPYATFVENALTKARAASLATGLPALADDSGICVGALGGAPGVHSARYAPALAGSDRQTQDQRNNAYLLDALAGMTHRQAHYYCVVVWVRHADDPQPVIAEGEWHGQILVQGRGTAGFGYDPLFWIEGLGRTVAELSAVEKNQFSHRAQAMAQLFSRLVARGYLQGTGSV